jgi:hypothetical protein
VTLQWIGVRMKKPDNPHEQGEHALRQAHKAAKRGDLAAAAHWSKVADQMSRAAERLAANPPPVNEMSWEEEEELRAELRRRIQRFVAADQDIQRWEAERDAYVAALERARREGAPGPPPLRMHPAGPRHMEEEYLTHILMGPEPDDGVTGSLEHAPSCGAARPKS